MAGVELPKTIAQPRVRPLVNLDMVAARRVNPICVIQQLNRAQKEPSDTIRATTSTKDSATRFLPIILNWMVIVTCIGHLLRSIPKPSQRCQQIPETKVCMQLSQTSRSLPKSRPGSRLEDLTSPILDQLIRLGVIWFLHRQTVKLSLLALSLL